MRKQLAINKQVSLMTHYIFTCHLIIMIFRGSGKALELKNLKKLN